MTMTPDTLTAPQIDTTIRLAKHLQQIHKNFFNIENITLEDIKKFREDNDLILSAINDKLQDIASYNTLLDQFLNTIELTRKKLKQNSEPTT